MRNLLFGLRRHSAAGCDYPICRGQLQLARGPAEAGPYSERALYDFVWFHTIPQKPWVLLAIRIFSPLCFQWVALILIFELRLEFVLKRLVLTIREWEAA